VPFVMLATLEITLQMLEITPHHPSKPGGPYLAHLAKSRFADRLLAP
jgi:hypothetical protein